MEHEGHISTITRWFILPTLVLVVLMHSCTAIVEFVSLRSLSERLNTGRSKAEVVAHVTRLLEAHIGFSRTEVRMLFSELGGQVTFRDHSLSSEKPQESVYWTLAELPGSVRIWAHWTLYYDAEDRLTEVLIGPSFP
jgi:phenylpyruvate tautomerase PptA (4-oxalocrotonate tautomerase family)